MIKCPVCRDKIKRPSDRIEVTCESCGSVVTVDQKSQKIAMFFLLLLCFIAPGLVGVLFGVSMESPVLERSIVVVLCWSAGIFSYLKIRKYKVMSTD